MTKLLSTLTFGIVKSTLPLVSRDHGFSRSASLARAIAARASAAFLSSAVTSPAVSAGGGGGSIGLPPGAMSSSSLLTVSVPQVGRFARCDASQSIEPDFGCGFQSNLAAGTRSSVLRTPAISWSYSGKRVSAIVIFSLPRRLADTSAGARISSVQADASQLVVNC